MSDAFLNVYADRRRAESYARLEFPGTYALAFRDLPGILAAHVEGRRALDFGCGAGRSTRFLRACGFEVTGVDISPEMISEARVRDPHGDYRLMANGDFGEFAAGSYDVATAVFTFDNIPMVEKTPLLAGLGRLTTPGARIVLIVSSPELYIHEWASFSTADFPENWRAGPGDTVQTVMKDVEDRRPVDDVYCPDDSYRAIFEAAGLAAEEVYRPLAGPDEPGDWVHETEIAPWVIYVLAQRGQQPGA
ncbi:class I SAM-dependent DNA methyltransferase [Paludibaculum fermentans]|uniref:class I SAM-dependent DNA methyltransferase n=1 Tax=Paludibaculum fermentans TaxID=1473598 RepID=UPI003EBE85BB